MTFLIKSFASYETTHALIERETGKEISEPAPFTKALRTFVFYNTWFGRQLMRLPITWVLLGWEHKRMAAYANSPESKNDIPNFIKTYQIKPEESEKPMDQYATLQEFFARRLRPGMRPIAEADNPSLAVHPADSRVVVFASVDEAHRMWIKGRHFTVGRLLGPGYDPSAWKGAAIVVSRLSPCDCHLLFASVTGRVVKISREGTRFMASMWVSTHSNLDVMTENVRLVMEFDSPAFGTVVQVMIGASDVGSVQPVVKEGETVTKGQQVAYFGFGGSIMATLFHRGTIQFDQDLLQHSAACCETRCTYGSSLGRARQARSPAGAAPAGSIAYGSG